MEHQDHLSYPSRDGAGTCSGPVRHAHAPMHAIDRAGLTHRAWTVLGSAQEAHLATGDRLLVDAGQGWASVLTAQGPTRLRGPLRYAALDAANTGVAQAMESLYEADKQRPLVQADTEAFVLGACIACVAFVAIATGLSAQAAPGWGVEARLSIAALGAMAVGLHTALFARARKRRALLSPPSP